MNDMPDLCADRDPRRLEQRFADSAARWPDRVAVSFGRERLTYAALHERATAIARGLRAHGLAPNAPVGICMRRSPDLIATIIAIYMADCAYVAIDPVNPVERRTHIQRDSGVTVVVADTQFAADGNGWLTIDGLVAERVPDAARDDRLPAEVALAYVLYTSGSTGLPKGTLVSHANVTSLLDACRTLFDFDETDVWTQLHSYGFDFSVWEIWGALAYGGHLVIVGDDDVRDPARLAAILAAEGVTVLNQTPLAFAVLADHLVAAGGPPPDLSLVIFGGAPLDTASVRRWFASVPGGDAAPVLVNMFGITETTVHVTYCPLRSSLLDGVRTSIGRALPNLRVSLRDGYGREVAPGVIGEIFVAGDGVSWGIGTGHD